MIKKRIIIFILSLLAVFGGLFFSSAKLQKPASVCKEDLYKSFDCYEAYYKKLVVDKGAKTAFDDLKKRYAVSSYVRTQCHPLTHVIGRAASEKFSNVGEAYKYGDGFCWSGYYHGILEGVIKRIGLKNLPREMDGICSTIPGKAQYSFDYYNCVHGLGHGVMAITQDQLFNSLKYCDDLAGSWEQQSCASGVFMENVIVDGKNHKTDYLKPSEPLYPCTAVEEKYKNPCYLMQSSYALKIEHGDFKKTFDWCKQADVAYMNTCYASIGRDASGWSISNIEKTKATCLLGEDAKQRTFCVVGAVKDFASYYHSDIQAKKLCEAFDEEEIKTTCNATLVSYYKQLQIH